MSEASFPVTLELAKIIQRIVIQDKSALQKWNEIVNDFPIQQTMQLKIERLVNNDNYEEGVRETLSHWISCEGSNATFGNLIHLLRSHQLNKLSDQLEEEIIEPKCVSLSSQVKSCNTLSRKEAIWFNITDTSDDYHLVKRQSELNLLHELFINYNQSTEDSAALSSSTQIAEINGLAGVGKSTLARNYAIEYSHYYNENILWINADSIDKIRSSFLQLANNELELHLDEDINNDKLAKKVYQYFENCKCLFIFDNVEEKCHFEQFRPKIYTKPSQQQQQQQKVYILITSQNNLITRPLKLYSLNEQEAIKLIMDTLENSTYKDSKDLATKLDCLPLALQQAIAYIKETYLDESGMSAIQKYLNDVKKLNTNPARTRQQLQPILITWNLTFKRIEMKPNGKYAINLIQILAYLHPDYITLNFLREVINLTTTTTNYMNIEAAVILLRTYSLITYDDKKYTINIHRLVQQAIKYNIGPQQEIMVLSNIISTVDKQLNSYKFTELQKECTNHGLLIFKQYYIKSEVLIRRLGNYSYMLCWYLNTYGNYDRSKFIAIQAVEKFRHVFGIHHEFTLQMEERIASAINRIGNVEESFKLQQTLFQKVRENLGEENWLLQRIRTNLALAFMSRRMKYQPEESLNIFNKLINLQIKLLPENHPNTLESIHNKARALFLLGDNDESLAIFDFVYERRKAQFSAEHPDTLSTLYWKAAVLKKKGKNIELCYELYKELYESTKKVRGANNSKTKQYEQEVNKLANLLQSTAAVGRRHF